MGGPLTYHPLTSLGIQAHCMPLCHDRRFTVPALQFHRHTILTSCLWTPVELFTLILTLTRWTPPFFPFTSSSENVMTTLHCPVNGYGWLNHTHFFFSYKLCFLGVDMWFAIWALVVWNNLPEELKLFSSFKSNFYVHISSYKLFDC